jgi:hypothetical protein
VAQADVERLGGLVVRAEPQSGLRGGSLTLGQSYPAPEGPVPQLLTAPPAECGKNARREQRRGGKLVRDQRRGLLTGRAGGWLAVLLALGRLSMIIPNGSARRATSARCG